MFSHLGFDAMTRYVGFDFSQAMLDSFSARFPDVELIAADAAEFQTAEKFDLVFSSHVSQYWDRAQLAGHLDHAASMITPGGLIVIAGTPWARMRLAYARGDLTGGDLTGGKRRPLPMAVVSAAQELIKPDIGHWYDLPDFTKLASSRGLQVAFRGSGHYPYRFHAIFQARG
jgi:SAM-dependent methyltransferase